MEIFYKKMFSRLTLINKTIFKKYKILKIIGKGSFGSVYKGKNIITDEPVAIKVEDISAPGNILQHEAYILFYLKNYGIPEFKSYGVYKRYRMLVQSLLGENTEKIFSFSDNNDLYNEKIIRKKIIKDVCMIAIQLIDRLEFIHSKYIIHRDLKPENIMLDLKTQSIVYLIDFGMAKKYRSGKTKKHVKFSIPYRLTGTARYCSVNALKGTEQSRRDDLESAGYVLIYLAQNKQLPWAGLNIIDKLERYRAIYQIKKRIKPEDLCRFLPKQFCDYIKYVKKLNFEEDPDYNYLRGLFINLLNEYNTLNDLKFSWLNNKALIYNEEQSSKYRRNNLFKKKGSPQQRILQNIQTSREKENKMDNLNQEKLINIIEENQEKRDRELMESSSKKNKDFNSKEDTPSFMKIEKNELSDEAGSKIAHINLEIILDESDLIKEKEEHEENKMNIQNKKNNNENEKDENINNNKNIFLFENESFNGSYKSNELKKNDNNNIIINNSKENKNLELNKNKNKNSPIKNNIVNIKIENCKENEININKAKTKMNNLNKGKIINITKYNIQNNNSPNKNQIQIIKDNNMIEKKKTQIKKIKLDINNNNNIIDNLYFNKSKSAMNSLDEKNDITINTTKSRRNFNKYNIINKSKSNRNIINYNKINILKYNNSTGKIIKNKRINVIKSNQNIQNIKLINNKSAKQINTILRRTNYKKMFSPNSIKISTNQIKRINPNKMVLTPDKLNKTIRIVNYKENNQEINKIFFSRSKSPDNSILRPNLFNSGQFNSKFNNNIINNISYYYNLKAEPNRTQSNTLENNKNKNLFMRLYNLKKGKKLENQRLKKIKININNKNLMSNLSGIDKINKKNSYNNIKKNLILPIFDYTNNFFEYNKIINNNYNNTVGNI